MQRIPYPGNWFDPYLDKLDGDDLVPEHYEMLGALVLRGVIPSGVVGEWIDEWNRFYADMLSAGRDLDPFNAVVLKESVPETLGEIYRDPVILDLMEQIYPDLGFYLQRFVIKDLHNREPVFLHQDYSYNLGWPQKTSVFLPLSPMNPGNGGLVLYPGTHHLGYLGDAGELDAAVLDPAWPRVAPSVKPGDLILMHDCTWHESLSRTSDMQRILVQITYQPSSDPSSQETLRGREQPGFHLDGVPRKHFFKRSRSSRIRELQTLVDRLES